jgi:serine/threonine protein kinase
MAPELHDLAFTDFSKCDTFSLGVILVNMLTGLKYVPRSSLADEFSDPALVTLLEAMLEPDFRARIELSSVLDAPWLKGPLASEKQISAELSRLEPKINIDGVYSSVLPKIKLFTQYTTLIMTPKPLAQVESLLRTASAECNLNFERPSSAIGWLVSDKVTLSVSFGFSEDH